MEDQLTLFKPRGTDYVRHTTASPPGLKMLSTPLCLIGYKVLYAFLNELQPSAELSANIILVCFFLLFAQFLASHLSDIKK